MDTYSFSTSFTKISKGRKIDNDSPEESGWTHYFEDFLSKNQEESNCSSFSYSDFGSSSMVSDAASCVPWKLADSEKSCKKLNLKKRRSRVVEHFDDSLEDTASSPDNSPKISHDLRQIDVNPRKKFHGSIEISLEEGRNSAAHCQNQQISDERYTEMSSCRRESECITELKKRGLCLVPLSMLVNYLG